MTTHPDLLTDQQATKAIARGGRQAADDQAMEAYWLALEEGKSVDEAGVAFIKAYQKMVRDGK